jgi:hypothetical protein
MKKKMMVWAMMLMVSVSTFAHTMGGVTERIIREFQKEFAGAKDVQWETGKAFVKATFTLHGQVMFAYYSNDASLLAVTRNITTNQLPMGLLTDVKKNYANYWISDLFEMVADNETSYYVTLESADSRVVLKSTDSTTWQVYKKEKKNDI